MRELAASTASPRLEPLGFDPFKTKHKKEYYLLKLVVLTPFGSSLGRMKESRHFGGDQPAAYATGRQRTRSLSKRGSCLLVH